MVYTVHSSGPLLVFTRGGICVGVGGGGNYSRDLKGQSMIKI